jgi:uncharacterized membrane protein
VRVTLESEVSIPAMGRHTGSGRPSPESRSTIRSVAGSWLVPAGLLLLSAAPLAIGAVRIGELSDGTHLTPATAHYFASPLPLVLHIVSASVYSVFGAFQFAAGFRRRWPRWHRAAGRLLVPCGLLAALSALWMTQFYPRPQGTGELLYALRLFFGSAMVLSIVLGFFAICNRDVPRHRAWMARAYAIGLGTGTQVINAVVGLALFGPADELRGALQMAASWLINLAVAEWTIRKRAATRAQTASKPSGQPAASFTGGTI